jgi:hypothetical protein
MNGTAPPQPDTRVHLWARLAGAEGDRLLAKTPSDPSVSQITALRNEFDTDLVHAAIELTRARARAARKFGPERASTLWCDDDGIQMASSPAAARYKATRFRETLGEGAPVVDLCCGIGGDLIGLVRAGLNATGVDLDPLCAWMAARNTGATVLACDVLDPIIPKGAFHLDPSRRAKGRTHRIDDYQPAPNVWDRLIADRTHGCIKLNPGISAHDLPQGELEILSESGSLTQALCWTGDLATAERRATLLRPDGSHCTFAAEPDRPDDSNPIDTHLATMDPSIERADLVHALLDETHADLVHPGTGLLTSAEPVSHPMLMWYRVLDVLPWKRKHAIAALRSHNAGIVAVKARAGACDPDLEQRHLRGSGSRELVVFVYPIDRAITCIIAERLERKDPAAIAATGPGGCGHA